MKANKLQSNKGKTKFIVLGLKNQLRHTEIDALHLEGDTINSQSVVKNLGVYMDEHFSMKIKICKVCRDCYFHIKNIYKIRSCLTFDATKMIVHALIISRLDYCNSLYYGLSQGLIKRLEKVQKAAAFLITRKNKSNPDDNFRILHWLPIQARIDFKILLWTYKCMNQMAPEYLCKLLKIYIPGRDIRSARQNLLHQPSYCQKRVGYRAFSQSVMMYVCM